MTYPGDASLTRDIQERILTTFEQTLDLAKGGKRAEALLGCDFMLSLDPLFEPARSLQRRVESSEGAVDVENLRAAPEPKGFAGPEGFAGPKGFAEPKGFAGSEGFAHANEMPLEALVDDPGANDLDSMAAGEVPSMASATDARVQKLLDEGQKALDGQHYQEAIDSWSRIFLIEIDNSEANHRIENAQRLKAEREREIEELFSEGERHLENGEAEQAEEVFGRILRLQPDHPSAQQALESILNPRPRPTGVPNIQLLDDAPASPEPGEFGDPLPDLFDPDATIRQPVDFAAAGFPTLDTSSPPPLSEIPLSGIGPKPPLSKGGSNRRFAVIGSAVLVFVLLASAMVWSNWGRLFPNSAEEPVARTTRQRADRITRIHALYQDGREEDAIAALESIGMSEPDYDRAQLLLEEWRAPAETPISEQDEAAQATQRQQLIELAREAYAETEYLPAARLFARASAIAPLDATEADLFNDAKRQLEPLAQMIDLYTQREYELVLPSLWRFYEENPSNRDVRRLLVNVHYNQAVRDLRRNRARQAKALLDEALDLDPQDAFAQRLMLFADTYSRTPRDLLYQIFVDNLETRP